MGEPSENLVLEILKKMQTDLTSLKGNMATVMSDVADIKTRVGRLEDIAKRQRRDIAGIVVIMKSVAGDFEERISSLEDAELRRSPEPT